MRRPLCVFSVTLLLTQVAIVYLPQNLLLILAAFFAIATFVYFIIKRNGYCVCIVLGLIVGTLLFFANEARYLKVVEPYLEQCVTLTARVESPRASYIEGMVSATLQVDTVNGETVSFACDALLLPESEEGDLIQGDFEITKLNDQIDLLSNYSDGVFVSATYQENFSFLGKVGGIRGFFIGTQDRLSRIIRIPFSEKVGGVIAAMTVGDRDYVLTEVTEFYRKAGLSHVLVVSGLHLSLICGMVLIETDTRHRRLLRAIVTMGIAVLLVGITGGSASILRAAFVLLMCVIATLVNQRADSFTSLAFAGVVLTCTNGYVVCNLSFQLSFLATFGVLLGGSFAEKTKLYLDKIGLRHPKLYQVYVSLVITMFATLLTFPVLVLWDMNVSLLAFVSNLLTFWMIPNILVFGLLGALIGVLPFCGVLSTWFLTVSAIMVAFLNIVVEKVALLPGAQLYFEREYAAIVCAMILVLGAVAYICKIRYRVAIPCVMAVLLSGVLIGNYFAKDIIKVAMVGSSTYPAVVISQNKEAMVLFRGGASNTQTIERYLEKRDIEKILLLVDLRMDPSEKATLPEAEETVWLGDTEVFSESVFAFNEVTGTLFNADIGGVVVLDFGGTTIATTSGTVTLSKPYQVDVLLSTASSSGSVVTDIVLCRTMRNPDFENYSSDVIYYGEESARLWIQYGGDYQLIGVKNGE